jgi:hypothetical protein
LTGITPLDMWLAAMDSFREGSLLNTRALLATACLVAGVGATAVFASSGGAATLASPASLIENPPAATSVYGLHDSAGHTMDTVKVVVDPTTASRYLSVYHWLNGSTFNVGVATSTDLRTWTYRRTLDANGSQPYLAFSPAPKDGPILADEGTPTNHLRFKYWTSVSAMLGTTAAFKTFDAPQTLSKCAEGTPSITSVAYASASSTITSGSKIVVTHHYFENCQTDREASGTLTDFSKWTTTALSATDTALTDAGAAGKHGDRDTFTYQGARWELFEGQNTDTSESLDTFRPYLYDGVTARQLNVNSAKGSAGFANPSVTLLPDPSGVQSLLVTFFVPSGNAASGEAGEMLYWQPLTTVGGNTSPANSSTPAPTSSGPTTSTGGGSTSITPTSSITPTATPSTSAASPPTINSVDKVLVFIEENHSLSQEQAGMPYLYSQSTKYGYASSYTAITHPSEPNYVAIGFGSTMGDTSDHSSGQNYAAPTVFGQALTNGRTAKVYQESMTSNCQNNNSGGYYTKHNPWLQVASGSTDRAGCAQYDVPMGTTTSGNMASDITGGTLPNVGFATPDINNDAHDGTLATADAWLKGWLTRAYAGPDWKSGHLAIIVTADEDDRNHGNNVLTTVIHPSQSGHIVSAALNHYSLTGFLSAVGHAACLRSGCTAPSFARAFGLTLS